MTTRNAKIGLSKGREAPNPKETFDVTTPQLEVAARPTDPFVASARGNADVGALASTLKDINSTLGTYTEFQASRAKENSVKAKADEMQGTYEKPSGIFNLGLGYDETWKINRGESLALKFNEEYERQLKDNNYFIDAGSDDEARQMRQKLFNDLYQTVFQGVKDPYILAGASERYRATKVLGDTKAEAAIAQKNVDIFLTDIGQIQRGILKDALDNPNVDPLVMKKSLDQYWKGISSQKNIITRDQFTASAIEQTGHLLWEMAQERKRDGSFRYSTSELSQRGMKLLALFNTPSGDSVPWKDIVSGHEYKFRAQASHWENVFNQAISQRETQDAKQLNLAQEMNKSKFIIRLWDKATTPEDMDRIREEANQMRLSGQLSMSDHDALTDTIRKMQDPEFRMRENNDHVVGLTLSARSGHLNMNQVQTEFRRGNLKRETAEKLMSVIDAHQKWGADQARQGKTEAMQEYRWRMSNVHQALDIVSPFDTDMNSRAIVKQRVVNAANEFESLVKGKGMDMGLAEAQIVDKYTKLSAEDRAKAEGRSLYPDMNSLVNAYRSGRMTETDFYWERRRLQAADTLKAQEKQRQSNQNKKK